MVSFVAHNTVLVNPANRNRYNDVPPGITMLRPVVRMGRWYEWGVLMGLPRDKLAYLEGRQFVRVARPCGLACLAGRRFVRVARPCGLACLEGRRFVRAARPCGLACLAGRRFVRAARPCGLVCLAGRSTLWDVGPCGKLARTGFSVEMADVGPGMLSRPS